MLSAHEHDRPRLRADAQENYDRIVEAASRVFARDGRDGSLKAVAEEAGVGIGTLYRRFPTRDSLVEAVYRSRVSLICSAAADLLAEGPTPLDALREWSERFVRLLVSKYGLTEALKPVLADSADFRLETRTRLTDAVELLLSAGQHDGSIRDDVSAIEVLRGVSGIAFAVDDFEQARRVVGLLLDGLTVRR